MEDNKLQNQHTDTKKQFFRSVLLAFSFVFTFILYVTIDLFASNRGSLPFYFSEMIGSVLVLASVVFVILALLLFLTKGVLHKSIYAFILGLTLIGYVQGMFFNVDFGELTGDAINWGAYTTTAVINTLTWIAIMVFIMFFAFSKKKKMQAIYKQISLFVPILIVGMQATGLASILLTTDVIYDVSPEEYLSTEGRFDLSKDDNILVFLIDRLDVRYIDDVQQRYSDFFEELDGFTYYDDNTSLYCRTFPAVVNMLTGKLWDYSEPAANYFDDAYKTGTFIPTLQDAGYDTKIYISKGYSYSDVAQVKPLASNVIASQREVDNQSMLAKNLKFAAFRYMPHILKKHFYITSNDFTDVITSEQNNIFAPNDKEFYDSLLDEGLTANKEDKNFMYYHFFGSHAPYTLDENVQEVEESDSTSQTIACFKIIYEYIAQLKKLGLYDKTTIIITGDHPKSEDIYLLDRSKVTALFVKPKEAKDTKLIVSKAEVSHSNFQASILKAAGVPYSDFGLAYDDISEEDEIVRKFYYRVSGTYMPDKKGHLESFDIRGNARIFSNWKKYDDIIIKHPYG